MNKIKLFKHLYANMQKRDAYFYRIPSDINAAFFDNEYVNSIDEDRSMMLRYIFGDHTEAIEWFLYEWQPGYEVGCDGVTKKIMDIDQYIEWMQQMEGFDRG